MLKIYKRKGKYFTIIKSNPLHDSITNIFTFGGLLVLTYINKIYLGNYFGIWLFIAVFLLAIVGSKFNNKRISKEELLKELKNESN